MFGSDYLENFAETLFPETIFPGNPDFGNFTPSI
jgi:hypothetical protein